MDCEAGFALLVIFCRSHGFFSAVQAAKTRQTFHVQYQIPVDPLLWVQNTGLLILKCLAQNVMEKMFGFQTTQAILAPFSSVDG